MQVIKFICELFKFPIVINTFKLVVTLLFYWRIIKINIQIWIEFHFLNFKLLIHYCFLYFELKCKIKKRLFFSWGSLFWLNLDSWKDCKWLIYFCFFWFKPRLVLWTWHLPWFYAPFLCFCWPIFVMVNWLENRLWS